MTSSANKEPEININEQRISVRELVNLISAAAHLGDETAQKVMDDVQIIFTTDWDDLPEELRKNMARVLARIFSEEIGVTETDEQQE